MFIRSKKKRWRGMKQRQSGVCKVNEEEMRIAYIQVY